MISDLLFRLRALFRRKSMEAELDEELRAHFAHQVEKYAQSGLPVEEAERRARLKFGGLDQVKEECRDARGVRFIETTIQDVRFGLRMLRKNRSFSLVAILTLMLGIGANTAIFSVVRAVLLKPLPYPDPDRLVVMREYQIGSSDMSVNWLNFLDWRAQSRLFEEMAAYSLAHFTLTGEGEAVLLRGATVSASYFPLLGVQPALGRAFMASDDRVGAAPVVILSHDLWQKRFGSQRSVVGKIIALDGKGLHGAGCTQLGVQGAPGR